MRFFAKRFKVHIYDSSDQEPPRCPVATVVLTDQRKRACWLPDPVPAEARFFLERVETKSEEVEQLLRSILQQPFVIVSKGSSGVTGAIRTRGDYSAQEPYGTPTFWRAAVGLLKSQAGLPYNREDYRRMLQRMEAAAPPLPEPEPEVADRHRVLTQCSLYILRKLGDGLWAGKAAYDEARQQWTVPIHAQSLGAEVSVGEITLDIQGNILHAPSRREVQRAVQQHQADIRPSKPMRLGTLTWQFMSTVGGEAGAQILEFSFIRQEETETVSGRLRFAPREGGVMPQLGLDPAPDTPCPFTLRFPDGTERVLTVDESGWSAPCEVVPQAIAEQWRNATLSFGEATLRLEENVGGTS